jgi:hypothetical protein
MAQTNYLKDLIEQLNKISNKNIEKDKNSGKFFETITLTLKSYYDLVKKGYISANVKVNRPDVESLEKRQGIMSTLLNDNSFGVITLYSGDIILEDGSFVKTSFVIDGGHRTRTILKFLDDEFVTGDDTYYLNDKGIKVWIKGKKYSEIKKDNPELIERLESQPIVLTTYHNISVDEITQLFHDLNSTSDVNRQEKRNSYDHNVVSEFVRNTARFIIGENNIPHKLFIDNFLELKDDRLSYDLLVTRIAYCVTQGNHGQVEIDISDDVLDEFFKEGSMTDNRHWAKNTKAFDKVKGDVIEILDYLYEMKKAWPIRDKRAQSIAFNWTTITALIRFLITVTNRTRKQRQKIENIDYKVLAKKIHDRMHVISRDNKPDYWVKNAKTERTKAEAFFGFLAEFKNIEKIKRSVEWLFEDFDNLDKPYTEYGLDVRDYKRNFDGTDIYERGKQVDFICESCKKNINSKDARGDHKIPWSWGIEAGGVTEFQNLQYYCEECNKTQSDKKELREEVKAA